jgi:hypothetical protein
MRRKGQSISINAIIIAALALIVLIVLIMVFSGRMSIWGREMDTQQKGRTCADNGGSWKFICDANTEKPYSAKLQDSNSVDGLGKTCCIKGTGSTNNGNTVSEQSRCTNHIATPKECSGSYGGVISGTFSNVGEGQACCSQ